MSANLVVDLGATCDYALSLDVATPASLTIGSIVDLANADTNCNIWVAGGGGSGVLEIRVQTSDGTTSGGFTDPTSGRASNQLPSFIASGGIMYVNSGLAASGNQSLSAPVNTAPLFCSGGIQFGSFIRPHRYARLIVASSLFPDPVLAGFISNKRTTGSGGGFTFAPGSGTVNV